MMRRAIQFVLALLLATTMHTTLAAVSTTKHNLSISGPGTVKASSESQICIFCHTPHNAAPNSPLWNRRSTGSVFTPYSSTTAIATPGQPTGASILCLSCHDGTIALGEILSSSTAISMAGGVSTMPVGAGRLGTDLSDDHPISFNYTAALASQRGELVNPSTLTGAVKLDRNGQLQCTSCHNPHDDTNGKFLVMANTRSALCQSCHVKNFWLQSSHSTSNATWSGVAPDPWPNSTLTTVANNACLNCHKPHSAGGRQRLLNSAVEESNCSACHNGHVAAKDIMSEFNKFSRHPITNTSGVHDPKEPAVVSARHVECYDCHNPHAARAAATGNLAGPLTGVRGVNASGSEVNPVTREYEVCFRCHADSTNKPAARTARLFPQTNVRLEFDTANPSYHPVEGAGKNPNVPSLAGAPAGLTTSSTINCSDCHNNDSGPKAGGVGPNGPHGSTYAPLLVRQYLTADPTIESASTYALCYNCHNRTSILGNQSFPRHSFHIGGGTRMGGGMGGGGMGGMASINAPCNNCHDPHGISITQGNNSKLINFNTGVVSPSSSGILRFESLGTYSGRCYLSCHGMNHNPCTYGTGGGMGGGMCGGMGPAM
jgi:predicted CXXCH cytochrome family protein